jgi:hypothetical protein
MVQGLVHLGFHPGSYLTTSSFRYAHGAAIRRYDYVADEFGVDDATATQSIA